MNRLTASVHFLLVKSQVQVSSAGVQMSLYSINENSISFLKKISTLERGTLKFLHAPK